MPAKLAAEAVLEVGTPLVVECESPRQPVAVVFEDDGDTGYFYALDRGASGNPIVDALHIYNVAQVSDRDRPSQVQIGWSHDGMKAVLVINHYPHAVVDFAGHRAYCRTGFPPRSGNWAKGEHDWDDKALRLFD